MGNTTHITRDISRLSTSYDPCTPHLYATLEHCSGKGVQGDAKDEPLFSCQLGFEPEDQEDALLTRGGASNLVRNFNLVL